MISWPKVLLVAGPLLLLALTAVAGYAYSQIRYLSLPIPQSLALFTVVLPLITGISTQGVYGLIQRLSKNEQYQLTIPLIAVIGFQLMYETIVATLALTHIVPPSALRCGLDARWLRLYQSHNARAIRTIQDTFECCGLNSLADRAFPFGNPSTCAAVYGRNKNCFGEWRKAEQINAGLLFLVAVIVFILKLISFFTLLNGASWTRASIGRPFKRIGNASTENGEDDPRGTMRRLIENATTEEPYRDDPEAAGAQATAVNNGPRVMPSTLGETANEWADEEHGNRDLRVSASG